MAPTDSPRAPAAAWRWRIVGLLFLATMLNYMDRQAFGQTSRFILDEFGVPEDRQETVYGRIEAAFGYSFCVFQAAAGFFADRFSLRWLYVSALLVWSTAGCLTGLVPPGAIGALMACRVVLGFGEAFNWPCAVSAVRRVVPRESRGLANGIFHSGASIGAVVTPLVVLAIVGSGGAGWRNVFLVVGVSGVAWAFLWLRFTRGEVGRALDAAPADDADAAHASDTTLRGVFALRRFWLMLAVCCCVNVCWHFFRIWFVRYLLKDLRCSPAETQWLSLGFFVAADVGSLASGYAIGGLTRAGSSLERSRKWVMTGLACACLCAIPATQVGPIGAKMALFYVVAAGAMGGFAVYFSLAQDIVGRHTAQVIGIGGSAGWALIAASNLVVGPWADGQGTFVPAIVAASFIPLVAAAVGWFWPEPRGAGE